MKTLFCKLWIPITLWGVMMGWCYGATADPVATGVTNAPSAVIASPAKTGSTNAPPAVIAGPVKTSSTNAPAVIDLPPMKAMSPEDSDGTGMQKWAVAVMFNKMFGIDDFWDSAQGFAVEIQHLTDKPWTLGLTFAIDSWDGGGGVVDIPFTEYNEMTADGATLTYQFGLMGSYRYLLSEHYKLLIRLGLSYLTSDSSTRLTTSYTDYFDRQVTYELYMDSVSGLMGSAGLAIRKDAFLGYDGCFGQVGIDFQMFLAGNDVEWLRQSMESSFDAAVLRVGVGTKF